MKSAIRKAITIADAARKPLTLWPLVLLKNCGADIIRCFLYGDNFMPHYPVSYIYPPFVRKQPLFDQKNGILCPYWLLKLHLYILCLS